MPINLKAKSGPWDGGGYRQNHPAKRPLPRISAAEDLLGSRTGAANGQGVGATPVSPVLVGLENPLWGIQVRVALFP